MIWMIAAILAVFAAIAYMVYKLPTDPVPRHRKRPRAAEIAPAEEKDWKEIAARWEKKNNALLGDAEKMLMANKKLHQELEAQQAQLKDMMDKMALEKSWREKEQGNLEKARQREKELKGLIARAEKDLEREHSGRMAAERELQEIKVKFEAVNEQSAPPVEAASLSTTVKQLTVQVKDLLRSVEELKQKRADTQWVAKSEHDALLARLKEKGG